MIANVYPLFGSSKDAVLLKDVKVLTLQEGKMTKGSRSSPIPQLQCVGGSAKSQRHLYPKSVQCLNVGSDGTDVQWECKANIDSTVSLGKLDVSCEGYAYAEDPYILKGSCGLNYELEYTDPILRQEYYKNDWISQLFVWLFVFSVFGAIIYFIVKGDGNRNRGNQGGAYQPQPTAPPANGVPYMNGPSYYPGSASWGPSPIPTPSYGRSWSSYMPSFFTGFGTGYVFGRPWGSGPSYHHHHNTYSSPSYSSRSSGGSGVSSTSTGYSSTSRR